MANVQSNSELRYSKEDLQEFETLILKKINRAQNELNFIKETLGKANHAGTENSIGNIKPLEDSADVQEKENLQELAVRQQKFLNNLNKALIRIKNGTYGVCTSTGKLIPKDRLRAVPHTTQTIEAKLKRA
ncbi:TraR/DksA family transcriptional regulator [Persicobacter psychrovividus]|uniref:Molecular chaperone DnaK n=1 Tax=Persicobacter psychrovividus TaxID=387638 RepID=A0ABN6LFC5_9BACT|nr:molecular chaperone DnaK [Persicobacter psychrovividus]